MRLFRSLTLVLVAALGSLGPNAQAQAPASVPSLILTISVKPADRPALREDLAKAQSRRLHEWREKGVIVSYRLLFNRYADAGAWDAAEILTFRDAAALARWNEIERSAPAGLDGVALPLVTAIGSTPSDQVRHGSSSPHGASGDPLLVIPYDALVPIPEYLRYLDGYTLPQMNGWMQDGALQSYGLHIARYYAGRPWTAMLVLQYRGETGLARREEVVAKVRARLAADADWKAFSDNKKAIRAEKQLVVADDLASEGPDL